jgi:hypothetical protein
MNTFFKNSALTILAITLAVPVATSAPTVAEAGGRDAFVGGLVGGVIGGAIGSAATRPRRDVVVVQPAPVYREPVYVGGGYGNAHINWCASRYRSYRVRSNTYVTYGGRVKQCYSPYN